MSHGLSVCSGKPTDATDKGIQNSVHNALQQVPHAADWELKESDIRSREIPSPKDSAFIANMRSHKKIFHQLAEFGKILWEPGADSPEGVENDL